MRLSTRVFWGFFLCIAIHSMAMASEFTYQTFSLSPTDAQSLNQTDSKTDSMLFVANSKDGILYAGNRNLGRCVPLFENNPSGITALKNGTLQCKHIALKVVNGVIMGAITATKNLKLNLKLIHSMTLQQQEIIYQYPTKSKQSKNASITTQFYCSKDSKIQKILQSMYQKSFDCKNAKEVFLKNAQDSMQNYFQEMFQANNQENAIEEYLQTSPFERYERDFLYYFNKDLLVFSKSNYLYTGGAHGISSELGIIVSKENGIAPLNARIDFDNAELKGLLWQEYQNYLKSIETEAFVDFQSFKVSEAILIDYDSFVFVYQPYEIMPYAYGIIELRIPLEQMEKIGNFDKSPFESLFIP